MFSTPDHADAVTSPPAFSPVGPKPSGFYQDCDPGTGQAGTVFRAEDLNELIINLRRLLTTSGATAPKGNDMILQSALRGLANQWYGTGFLFFTTVGVTPWVVPTLITHVRYLVIGGGGGGGSANVANATGGGGGAGGVCLGTAVVTPGSTVNVTVANAGPGVANGNGIAGGTSSFGGFGTAYGGAGGVGGGGAGGIYNGGAGGSTSGVGNSIGYTGGDGDRGCPANGSLLAGGTARGGGQYAYSGAYWGTGSAGQSIGVAAQTARPGLVQISW